MICFNSHKNKENGGIILMVNMKKLKQKRVWYISETSRAGFKSRSVRFKNSGFFPGGIVIQENRFLERDEEFDLG